MRPFLALDAMDRGEHDAVGRSRRRRGRRAATLERRGVVVQRRDVADRRQVVALRRPVHAVAVGVEGCTAPAEPESRRSGRRRARRRCCRARQPLHAARCRRRTRSIRSVSRSALSRVGEPSQAGRRRAARRPNRRPAGATGATAGAAPRRGRRTLNDAPPVASRNQASTARTVVRSANSSPTPPATGTPAAPSASCTGANEALTRVSTATSAGALAPAPSAACTAAAVAATGSSDVSTDHPPGPRWQRPRDRLGDPTPVVPQQPIDRLDDAGRTAVVDLERMVAGAGEQRCRSRSTTPGRRRCSRRSSGRRRRRRTPRLRAPTAAGPAAGGPG